MSSRSPYEKAQTYNLSRAQVFILYRVAAWFNGYWFTVNNRKVSIGTAYEPTVRQLCGDKWTPSFDQEHERLIERGLFKSEERDEDIYVAGRRCRWSPSKNCMQIIEHIFSDSDQIYPNWALD